MTGTPVEDVRLEMLKAELFAQGTVINALIDTHPDKAALAEYFHLLSETYLANLLSGQATDAHRQLIQVFLQRWIERIQK